ncbi:MAG TPA: glycine oxidase ThiO [Rhizomicrobium sp.]|jgi:glycine oxidase|nr:glycine oxidase ThiO [Rhizomicrobium sp.]
MKVVIVGGGVAGLSIGWRLRQAGAEVVIVERAEPGRGATWASAGMIAASAELGHEDTAESQFARRSSSLWPVFAAEIEQATGVGLHYGQCGALIVASSRVDGEAFARRAAQDNEVSWLDRADAEALEPMLFGDFAGALWAPGEAVVDNRALGRALTHAFTRAGGELARVEAAYEVIVEGGKAVGLRTPFRTLGADAVVLAAGAWSGQLTGLPREVTVNVKPVKGEMIALGRPASSLMLAHVVWGNGVYLVPRRDRVLVGATVREAGFDTSTTPEARDWLRARANAVLPSLADWDEIEHWAGLRPGTTDGQPMIGRTSIDNLYAATGQFRNGILFAPAIAESVSRLVLEQKVPPEITAFDPRRFS